MIYISCNWELLNRVTEGMLYDYADADKIIRRLERQLEQKKLESFPQVTTSIVIFNHNSGEPVSKVEMYYTRSDIAATLAKIEKMKKEVEIMNSVMAGMSEYDINFMNIKYCKKKTRPEIAKQLGISVRWCLELDKRILKKVYHARKRVPKT